MATLAASHQTSSATRSLSALAHFLSIRQNGQSHPNLIDKINTAFDHVATCWESPIHAGYIVTEDLRAAAYFNALDASLYAAPKERFLAANPILIFEEPTPGNSNRPFRLTPSHWILTTKNHQPCSMRLMKPLTAFYASREQKSSETHVNLLTMVCLVKKPAKMASRLNKQPKPKPTNPKQQSF